MRILANEITFILARKNFLWRLPDIKGMLQDYIFTLNLKIWTNTDLFGLFFHFCSLHNPMTSIDFLLRI